MLGAFKLPKYPQDWLELPEAYVRNAVTALKTEEISIKEWWNDPFDPRDATVRLTSGVALVWDAMTGWRSGSFITLRPGGRTTLGMGTVQYYGDRVLPEPRELAYLFGTGRAADLAPEPYRHWTDLGDGLDVELRRHQHEQARRAA